MRPEAIFIRRMKSAIRPGGVAEPLERGRLCLSTLWRSACGGAERLRVT
jgi:hypothetical protein